LFSDDALAEPHDHYRTPRDLAPAVSLTQHDVWFMGRYDDVRAALSDRQAFSSANGIGLNSIIEAWKETLCSPSRLHV
jgi:cytochrome P450